MKKAKMMKKYAKLIAEIGIGANPKQDVVIRAPAEAYQFVRYLALELYNSKARSVSADFSDGPLTKESMMHVAPSRLDIIPDWEIAKEKERVDKNFARISLVGEDPALFRSVSADRLLRKNKALTEAFSPLKKAYNENQLAWCIAAVPTKAWAKKVFPNLSPTQAMIKLWASIYQACYVEEDNDPSQAWKKHIETLANHASYLNTLNLKALHYTNKLGTDLTVGLANGHQWCSAQALQTRLGTYFVPNIPTEEIFTMPDRRNISGKVVASRPLSAQGVIIDGFWMEFKNGKVVDFAAKTGFEKLSEIIHYDDNSSSLGEAALVPFDSPISKQHIIYQETLFDENASCHLALGFSFKENLKNSEKMTDDEVFERGGNQSKVHVDFMIGTEDLKIDGIKEDGSIVPIFVKGNFAF